MESAVVEGLRVFVRWFFFEDSYILCEEGLCVYPDCCKGSKLDFSVRMRINNMVLMIWFYKPNLSTVRDLLGKSTPLFKDLFSK